ncbi:centrosomal AT-AC splicing factor [Denticeps clupeoides]|uniref:centrosomal AT-AC splicing factor n=1 Tax=Denticeps clupeoides TaxID=299321 RepID=UPI0010A43590|nr:coiled-coil domain-containing protein 84 [Denticeps clupeoides]
MGAVYCPVCRQTCFTGKKHIFGTTHQTKLRVLLVRFLEKVKEARRTLKCPLVEKFDASQHSVKFWCYCCSMEVDKHVTDGSTTVLFGGIMQHMSSPQHRSNTHTFWWENKADPKLRDKFIITRDEAERFKAVLAQALEKYEEKEDLLINEHAAMIRLQEQRRLELLHSVTEPDPNLQTFTQHVAQQDVEDKARCGGLEKAPGPRWTDTEADQLSSALTFIGYQDSSDSGNVHTGGIPPWLQDDLREAGSERADLEIGPSMHDYLKHKEQQKLKKLPPNRVGGNFDHGSHTDSNWLPSFGRVWNNGRRWQSRRQFKEEEDSGTTHTKKSKV